MNTLYFEVKKVKDNVYVIKDNYNEIVFKPYNEIPEGVVKQNYYMTDWGYSCNINHYSIETRNVIYSDGFLIFKRQKLYKGIHREICPNCERILKDGTNPFFDFSLTGWVNFKNHKQDKEHRFFLGYIPGEVIESNGICLPNFSVCTNIVTNIARIDDFHPSLKRCKTFTKHFVNGEANITEKLSSGVVSYHEIYNGTIYDIVRWQIMNDCFDWERYSHLVLKFAPDLFDPERFNYRENWIYLVDYFPEYFDPKRCNLSEKEKKWLKTIRPEFYEKFYSIEDV